MNVTQEQYNVSKQINRTLYTKINLLNSKFQIVDRFDGVLLDGSSYNIQPESDIRRSCNLQIIPINTSFDITQGSKIWLDKYIQVFVGIKDNITKKIVDFNLGIYVINNPTRTFNSTSDTISLEGLDLICKYNGLHGGTLEGLEYIIKADENVRTAIITILGLAKIDKYVVDECIYPTVPNDINVPIGSTVWDILKQLRDIIPDYRMYFDVDGVFHYHLMPSGHNEQIRVDDDIFQKVLLDYSYNVDFSSLKNKVEVIGKTWTLGERFLGNSTFSNDTYSVSTTTTISNGTILGFVTTSASDNPKIRINSSSSGVVSGTIYTDETQTEVPIFDDTETYRVFKYKSRDDDGESLTTPYFIYYGEVEPRAVASELNVNSPFYIEGELGERSIVLSGGEYDNITNTTLAQERANWELYKRCKLQDSVTINCIPIYFLDADILAEITLPKYEKDLYMIKEITTNLSVSGTQTINLMKYYPTYENEEE